MGRRRSSSRQVERAILRSCCLCSVVLTNSWCGIAFLYSCDGCRRSPQPPAPTTADAAAPRIQLVSLPATAAAAAASSNAAPHPCLAPRCHRRFFPELVLPSASDSFPSEPCFCCDTTRLPRQTPNITHQPTASDEMMRELLSASLVNLGLFTRFVYFRLRTVNRFIACGVTGVSSLRGHHPAHLPLALFFLVLF
jgi:hypothetical protein